MGNKTPNDNTHIMYVWLDALTCYANGINYLTDKDNEMKEYWKNVVHIVGKDILRHHAVYWPAFLLAADLDLPKKYLHMDGGRMRVIKFQNLWAMLSIQLK